MDLGNIDNLIDRLKTFTVPDFYVSDTFIKKIKRYTTKKTIGSGGSASHVIELDIPGPTKYVLKSIRPCSEKLEIMQRYCKHLRDVHSIRQSPHGEDEDLIEMPNFLLEAIIGGFMKKIVEQGVTPHLATVLGVWIDPLEEKAMMLQPKYSTNIINILNSKIDVYNLIFQVAQGLLVAQELYRFTHYDLHGENIFYEETPLNIQEYVYPILFEDEIHNIYVQNRGFLAKIADYGLSRMEVDNIVLNSLVDDYPVPSRGLFNPGYDIASFVHYLFVEDMKYNEVATHITGLGFDRRDKCEIYSILYGDLPEYILNNYDKYIKARYQEGWWRPATKYGSEIKYVPVKPMDEILRRLALLLIDTGGAHPTPQVPQHLSYMYHPLDKYELTERKYRRSPRLEVVLNDTSRKIQEIGPGISLISEVIDGFDLTSSWEHTPTTAQIASCPYKTQYAHIVLINSDVALEAGYHLKSECCKLDVIDYMSKHIGLATNCAYFDINNSGKPLGPYKGKYTKDKYTKKDEGKTEEDRASHISNLPLPEIYKDDYRYVLLHNNDISIYREYPGLHTDYMFVAGPSLIESGIIVFDRKKMNSQLALPSGEIIKPYQCRLPKPGERETHKFLPPTNITLWGHTATATGHECNTTERKEKSYIPNCRRIDPGELSHASNPNPRTALIKRDNSDGLGDIAIVYVEGRDERGMGMSLLRLAQYIKQRVSAIEAVNLDGGRSSAVAWRTESDLRTVYVANPRHFESYPVGNILSLVKL